MTGWDIGWWVGVDLADWQLHSDAKQIYLQYDTCELSYCFQPKLSSAKSRLNVENFIAACRKLGVAEVKSPNNTSLSRQSKLCSFSNWDAAEFEFKVL